MNRDYFSALPEDIRHHILTYFEPDIVKRDKHGNVRYIGQAQLGTCIKAEVMEQEVRSRKRHRFAQVSRQLREDFFDLFFSLNKFEFGSGPLLLEFLNTMLDGRRLSQLTSLRFTLRSHANVPANANCGRPIKLMQRIYKLFFLCVNLKELEIRAQVHWRSTIGLAKSVTFPVEGALSQFRKTSPNETPISFGEMIEYAPRRHGYDEDPIQWVGLGLPQHLRAKYERVQWILASAYDIALKEKQEEQSQEQEPMPITEIQELTGGQIQDPFPPLHAWRKFYPQNEEEVPRVDLIDVEVAVPMEPGPVESTPEHPDGNLVMPSAYPVRCSTHFGMFISGCPVCKLEWEQDIDLELQRSVQSQLPPAQASPQTSFNVNPSEPGSLSPWCPNHPSRIEPTCPRCTAEGTANMDLEIGRMLQWHSPLPQAGPSEPLTPAMTTPAHSPRFHEMVAEKCLSWLDLSSPLYLLPVSDPNVFAYYLALMEWAWNNDLEQSRIDAMTRAILARVDSVAFEDWLYTPSGVPDPRET